MAFPERLLAHKVSTIKGYAERFSFTGGGLKGFHVVGVQIRGSTIKGSAMASLCTVVGLRDFHVECVLIPR